MKKLVGPGQVVIPSNMPRTNLGLDSRGPRLCFFQLGRSCSDKEGFFLFADGSSYAYTPESNGLAEILCAAPQRGKFFNLAVRRAGGGFTRGFVPPADYETIYSYPPYPGTAPDACVLGMIHWGDLIWAPVGSATGDAAGSFVAQDFSLSATSTITPVVDSGWKWIGTLTYNGPAAASNLDWGGTSGPGTGFLDNTAFYDCVVFQDGSPILAVGIGEAFGRSPDGSYSSPFTVNDTLGADSTITVEVTWTGSGIPSFKDGFVIGSGSFSPV